MSNVKEVKARGADVLCLTLESMAQEAEKTADHVFSVPATHPLLQPSLNVIPLQLFAYYVALARGCEVDKPGTWPNRSRWNRPGAAAFDPARSVANLDRVKNAPWQDAAQNRR